MRNVVRPTIAYQLTRVKRKYDFTASHFDRLHGCISTSIYSKFVLNNNKCHFAQGGEVVCSGKLTCYNNNHRTAMPDGSIENHSRSPELGAKTKNYYLGFYARHLVEVLNTTYNQSSFFYTFAVFSETVRLQIVGPKLIVNNT